MKKKKHLQTSFLRFLLEKQSNELQELPEDETNLSNKNLSDEFDRIINGDEVQDDEQSSIHENKRARVNTAAAAPPACTSASSSLSSSSS